MFGVQKLGQKWFCIEKGSWRSMLTVIAIIKFCGLLILKSNFCLFAFHQACIIFLFSLFFSFPFLFAFASFAFVFTCSLANFVSRPPLLMLLIFTFFIDDVDSNCLDVEIAISFHQELFYDKKNHALPEWITVYMYNPSWSSQNIPEHVRSSAH